MLVTTGHVQLHAHARAQPHRHRRTDRRWSDHETAEFHRSRWKTHPRFKNFKSIQTNHVYDAHILNLNRKLKIFVKLLIKEGYIIKGMPFSVHDPLNHPSSWPQVNIGVLVCFPYLKRAKLVSAYDITVSRYLLATSTHRSMIVYFSSHTHKKSGYYCRYSTTETGTKLYN